MSAYVAVDDIFQCIVLFVQLRQFNHHFVSIKYKFLLILRWVGVIWSFYNEDVIKFPVLYSNVRMSELLPISLNLVIATKKRKKQTPKLRFFYIRWIYVKSIFENVCKLCKLLSDFGKVFEHSFHRLSEANLFTQDR